MAFSRKILLGALAMNETDMGETLRTRIYSHNNDYRFNVSEVSRAPSGTKLPSLSVVIPYFQGKYLGRTLHGLYRAIKKVQATDIVWIFEIIVVDDGSAQRAEDVFGLLSFQNLTVIRFEKNSGRTAARNAGLNRARHDVVLFIDADILVNEDILLEHLRVHAFLQNASCISIGFFSFITNEDPILQKERITNEDIRKKLNDFRLSCTYQSHWAGCENDLRFSGKTFRIVTETRDFRHWPKEGFLGPWILPNMVLGGFFMVRRVAALFVGGFDHSFQGYGFTETSLPTKLIAAFGHFVVPVVGSGCLHIEDPNANASRRIKDEAFRKRHHYYFSHYLGLTLQQSIYGQSNAHDRIS